MSTTQTIIEPADALRPLFGAVDLGGTYIKIGVVDSAGRTLAFRRIATESANGAASAMQRASSTLNQALASIGLSTAHLAGVGLGTPGTLDVEAGIMLEPPNLPWRNYPARDRLAELTGLPVTFGNDANFAAYGEYWLGSGADYDSMVFLTLGTGVGGGIVIGDRVLAGEHSHGSECGHIVIDCNPGARMCSCGKPGHLEAYVSALSLIRRTQEALDAGATSSVSTALDAGDRLSGLLLAQHAEQGDELARDMIMQTAYYLGMGITSMMHMIDPAAVVLGGAMNFGRRANPLGREFLDRVQQVVRKHTFPVQAERITIDYAALGGDAGYLGAAGVARRTFLASNVE